MPLKPSSKPDYWDRSYQYIIPSLIFDAPRDRAIKVFTPDFGWKLARYHKGQWRTVDSYNGRVSSYSLILHPTHWMERKNIIHKDEWIVASLVREKKGRTLAS